ncbi:hypothetical protein CC79DRAFT_1336157 [Sarocladium strictum]
MRLAATPTQRTGSSGKKIAGLLGVPTTSVFVAISLAAKATGFSGPRTSSAIVNIGALSRVLDALASTRLLVTHSWSLTRGE